MDRFISEPLSSWRLPEIRWPEGKAFAFTVFDDPDFQTVERGRPVYDFLASLGFRTTRGVFPGLESTPDNYQSATCNDPEHLQWILSLKQRGFEIGWHGASPSTSSREETIAGLERFRRLFGDWPRTSSQHYECQENMYWGDDRLSYPAHRFVYNILTRWKGHDLFHGHTPGHALHWSDLCRERIQYVRSFTFANVNTLAACPFMPYHDPDRPDVNLWYASTVGHNAETFVRALSAQNQDRLEAEGGACIMYAHFAYRFYQNGQMNKISFAEFVGELGRR